MSAWAPVPELLLARERVAVVFRVASVSHGIALDREGVGEVNPRDGRRDL